MKPASPWARLWLLVRRRTLLSAISTRKKIESRKKLNDTPSTSSDNQMSDKIKKRAYKGIFFVDVEQLPTHQRVSILKWGGPATIKIKTERTLLNKCIQYDEYEKWYDEEYIRIARQGESYLMQDLSSIV